MTSRMRCPLLLAIIATLALAAVGAGCGGDGEGGSSDEAEALLKKAFATEVDSADLKIDVSAELEGVPQLNGPLSLTIEGPYKSQGKKKLPLFDWDISVEGAGQSFAGGLVVTADNAFVQFQGTNYEVGTELFQRFASQIEQQPAQAQDLKALGVDPASWLNDPEVNDGDDIGGDSTQVVTGDVDLERVVKDFYDLVQSPAIKQQLEAQGQAAPEIKEPSQEQLDKVKDAIENLKFEANVDENDVLRRVFLQAEFKVPEGTDAGSLQGGKASFEFLLNEVGNDPQIEAPEGARPLSELTQRFGLQGLGGGVAPGTTP